MTDGPYKLPSGWRWVRLGEVCQINPRRPRINRAEEAATSFIPMNAVDEREGAITELQARPFGQVKKGYTFFEEGDVLFAKITPCMENGKATIASGLIGGVGFGSTEFHVLRPGQELIARWALFFVRQECFRQEATKTFRGAVGQQRVPQEFLEAHPVPLPPLAEQCRIVARVEALMERVREAKRLRTGTRQDSEHLIQAVLDDILTEGHRQGWSESTIGDILSSKPQYGLSKKASPELIGIPILRMGNIVEGRVSFDDLKYINLTPKDEAKYLLGEGDILFNRTNSAELVGKSAVYNKAEKAVFASYLIRLKIDSSKAFPRYVAIYINSLLGQQYIQSQLTRAIGQVNLNAKKLQAMPILLPPLDMQYRVLTYLEQVQSQVATLRRAQEDTDADLRRLEQAILDRAFRGEL